MSFFGLELAPGKKFSQTVEIPFRVSMVALGHGQVKKERSTLTIKTDSEEGEFALCSLTPGSLEQQPVDLVFEAGEEVTLQVHGGNKLFLTGNYADEEDMMDMDPYSEDDEEIPSSEEEELDEDAVDKQAMRAIKAGKEKKVTYANEEMEEDSEEMDSEEMDSEEDDSEEDEYELTPEEEADMEEMFQKLFAERLANGESVEDLQAELEALAEQDSEEEDSEEEEEDEEPRITEIVNETTVLDANGNAQKAVETKVDVKPAPKKEAKKAEVPAKKEAKKVEAAPAKENNKKRAAETAPEQAKKQAKVETKTLPSGVQITDTKVGDGPRAKNGKRISMHYVGKLTSNNKQFDATKGKPFDFALGRGEVIKGFDIGVEGMQVNGERRIVIPAKLAYGNRKLPGIPANSSLTFDIKLVNVK